MPFSVTTLPRPRCAQLRSSLALALFGLTLSEAFAGSSRAELQRPVDSQHDTGQLSQALPQAPVAPAALGVHPGKPRASHRPNFGPIARGVKWYRGQATRTVLQRDAAVDAVPGGSAQPQDQPASQQVEALGAPRSGYPQTQRRRWLAEDAVRHGHAQRDALDPVVSWNGMPLTTTSSVSAIQLVLRCIEQTPQGPAERAQQARLMRREISSGLSRADSFGWLWTGLFGFNYRPMQIIGYDLKAAIERSIDDPSLDTERVESALIKLPRPMRFADLPHPDRIVAVVARSESANADGPRYVVIARLDPDRHSWRRLRLVQTENGSMRVGHRLLGREAEGNLVMNQVEYVIYGPQA